MQPEAIFRITYGRSERCCKIRRSSSRRHRRRRAFGLSRNRRASGDAGVHGGSRHALPWPTHPFGACLGRYLLARSGADQVAQGGAYRGDRADPPRRVTTDRLGLKSDCRFAFYRLLHLCLLSAAFAWSGTTHMSMTDLGRQRITHLQYLLRGDSLFPGRDL